MCGGFQTLEIPLLSPDLVPRRIVATSPEECPCLACFTPGRVPEATMNITPTHDFPSDGLFYCYLIRPFPKHLSISVIASRPESRNFPASCHLHGTSPSLLHKLFQNKGRNRNLAEFCNTELYLRSTFIESWGWGRAMSSWGLGELCTLRVVTRGRRGKQDGNGCLSPGGSRIIRNYQLTDGESFRKIYKHTLSPHGRCSLPLKGRLEKK